MKIDKYTVMFIPNDENTTRAYHISKFYFKLILIFVLFVVFLGITATIYYTPKINDYHVIKDQHMKFVSERSKVLDLTRDLERIKQMDEMVRSTLGSSLGLYDGINKIDSLSGGHNLSKNNISYIENIPSLAPVNGFVSQTSKSPGLFIKKSHDGIDIVAKEGEPILAAATGVVVFSGWTYEFGNMIILYHGDDYFTHYGHNQKNFKKQLDIVKRGEVIALVGSTGISTGPHLHFEVWREFSPVDPMLYFPEYDSLSLTLIK